MKKKYILALFTLLLSTSFVHASDAQVLSFSVKEKTWWNSLFDSELAIITDKSTYLPGETAKLTFASDVPCNMAYANLILSDSAGLVLNKTDVTSKFPGNCFTANIQSSIKLPAYAGTFKIGLQYLDYAKKEIYTDYAFAIVQNVATPFTCPTDYCTGWLDSGSILNGGMQTRSCYTYDKASNCAQHVEKSTRIVCNTGYTLNSGQCVLKTNPAVCGNLVVENGEVCDLGSTFNGACPATCSSSCTANACSSSIPDKLGLGLSTQTILLIAGAALVGGSLLWKRFS